ncbi:hypothetical protein D9M73_65930 [compost metagenome]|nr:MAG TPA: antitermination protein [Caudoviricetes sp.]
MARITDRYSSAVHSSNLKVSKETDKTGETSVEDTDALSAMAWADKALGKGWRITGPNGQGEPVKPAPLAVPLERLFAGDSGIAHEIVRAMAETVWRHARDVNIKLNRVEAVDLAKGCLAWHRNGACKACGGHGYSLIPGVPSLSSHECTPCGGTGKIRMSDVFPLKTLQLAQWLVDEMTREAGRAGPAAMKALVKTMEL